MPPKSEAYWRERIGTSTWYESRLLDWETRALWRAAVKRLSLPLMAYQRLLDVGCGDGRFSRWMRTKYHLNVIAVDYFPHVPDGAYEGGRVFHLSGVDAEELPVSVESAWKRRYSGPLPRFDWVMISGVLECTANWRKVLRMASWCAPRMLVIEDLRKEVPDYQRGLEYKNAIRWGEFVAHADVLRLDVVRWTPVTVLDRRLIYRCPNGLRTAGTLLSYWLDRIAAHTPYEPKLRACYLERRET